MTTQHGAPLCAKRQLFVDAYLNHADAKRSALEAGYSQQTAKQQGSRLLKNPDVSAAIAAAQAKRAERVRVTADDVLREAWAIATDRQRNDGARVSALALCAKHTGGFSDRVEHTGGGGGPIQVLAAVAELPVAQLQKLLWAALETVDEDDESHHSVPWSGLRTT